MKLITVVHMFRKLVKEVFINNENMHEYTVYVLGVLDFASHLLDGHWR